MSGCGPPKFADYDVVVAYTHTDLAELVREFLKDGWIPLGPAQPVHFQSGPCFSQTLYKLEAS